MIRAAALVVALLLSACAAPAPVPIAAICVDVLSVTERSAQLRIGGRIEVVRPVGFPRAVPDRAAVEVVPGTRGIAPARYVGAC